MPVFDPENRLENALMVVAFEGWNDAGEAATMAAQFLADLAPESASGEIDSEEFFDFQDLRPILDLEGEVRWPHFSVRVGKPRRWSRGLVTVIGPEPHLKWKTFAQRVLTMAHDLGVTHLVMLGSMLSDAPHSRPLPVSISGLTVDGSVQDSDYTGPIGITGVIAHESRKAGMTSTSLWVSVPHYVSDPPSPKATVALLDALEKLISQPIDLRTLAESAQAWQRGAQAAVDEDDALSEYVHSLEHETDLVDLPEASAEGIAAEFERYLRRREGGS